jgi:Family of unknown function (DUF5678)
MRQLAKLRDEPEDADLQVEEQIRSLLLEGRIRDAQDLLRSAGDSVPVGSKLREVLAPPHIRRSNVRGVDRTPEFDWLNEHWAEHEGKWVALVGDSLVASSGTLKELLAQIEPLKFDRKPLIHHLT